jgi:hypothetical protein
VDFVVKISPSTLLLHFRYNALNVVLYYSHTVLVELELELVPPRRLFL